MLKMPDLLEASPERLKSEPCRLLKESFLQTDRELRESQISSSVSGSTGLVLLLKVDQLVSVQPCPSHSLLRKATLRGCIGTLLVVSMSDLSTGLIRLALPAI